LKGGASRQVRILFVGDIVGRPGRAAARACIDRYRSTVDLVLANGENAAGGMGITFEVADELWDCGIDVITMGNHIWDKKEVFEFIADTDKMVRPINYPGSPPGIGFVTVETKAGHQVTVINACGRVFSPALFDDPFRALDAVLEQVAQRTRAIVVDFHSEATSEKVALGHYLDGRVSAVIGTHTHVQTADAKILPGGTGYITDAGMTGPADSVIGIKKEIVIQRFLSQMPSRFEVASGPWQFDAVLIEIDPYSGHCLSINNISQQENA
jgi:hypothetical protein